MSVNVTTYYAQQYAKIINQLVQQKNSRFRRAVTEDHYVGKSAQPVDQVGAVQMQPVTGRYQSIGRVDAPTDARWVYPNDYDLPQLFDEFDKLRLLVDPKSKFVENGHDAADRQIDDVIIAGMLGTNNTGQNGQNSITFPSSQIVSVAQGAAGATGLNVAKLRAALVILRKNEAIPDNDKPADVFCAADAVHLDNLLAEVQVTSSEFNGQQPVLKEGRIDEFLGVKFIHSERLPTGTDDLSGTSTKVPFWQKSGMHLGMWNDITTDISQRKDLRSLPWQAYIKLTTGATRLEEKRVVQIWCR